MVTGIEHTAIASADPLKLANWYVEHLDFVINYQVPNAKTVFIKAADGSMVEIIESDAPAAGTSPLRAPGLRHLALSVNDFDAVHQRLQAAGIAFLTPTQRFSGNTLIFFADPDGNILHLLHRETPLP